MNGTVMKFALKPLPDTEDFAVAYELLQTEVGLSISVEIRGKLDSIDCRGTQSDELWRGTCMELFIRDEGESYREINIAPDGRSSFSELSSYRKIVVSELRMSAVRMVHNTDSVTFSVELPGLSVVDHTIAVAVITADREGVRRFWGIDHWEGKPDFHRPENFVLFR